MKSFFGVGFVFFHFQSLYFGFPHSPILIFPSIFLWNHLKLNFFLEAIHWFFLIAKYMWNWELVYHGSILLHCIFLVEVEIPILKKKIQSLISQFLIRKDKADFQNDCWLRVAFLLADGLLNGTEYNFHPYLHH